MESRAVIAFPSDGDIAEPVDVGTSALAEIDAAIALVAGRAARRVRLTAWPFLELVAATGLAHARAAGVAFSFERAERVGVATVTVGPLE